jgi:3-methyladenine DNA glycosylase/8-oxoguanine DNA glycosylase
VPDLLGMGDAEADLPAEELLPAAPNVLHRLARRARGVRLARSDRVVEMLVPIVLQQKVSGKEAARAHRNLVLTFSQPAPGPLGERGLWLPLATERLRSLPGAALPPLGVSSRCAETLRRLGLHAGRLEEAASMPSDAAARRIGAVPGLGVWSVQSALLRGLGCADAVPVGDWNIPSAVAFTLSDGREQRADDARMLELLAPFVGQRGRVIRWVHAAGRLPPRRGPRMPLRPLPPVDGRLLGRLRR